MKKGLGVALLAGALLAALLFVACDSDSSASTDTGGSSPPPGSGASAAASVQTSDASAPQGISVSGEGRASAAPDTALLSIGVSTKEMTVAEANSEVQVAIGRLLNSLKGNGVAEKDIQTSQFSINPEYDYQYNQQRLTGYRVTHMLQVKVRDIDQAGKVIDDGVEAAGDLVQVGSISLTIDDTTALRSQAREQAMADAATKAQELARLADVELGKPAYISESSVTPYTQPYAGEAMAFSADQAQAQTTISPGELEVVVSVQITYGIQ
jgi:uncharacterized protein YggE